MESTERYYSVAHFNAVLRASPGDLDADCKVEGEVPEALWGGTYYLNGPGMLELKGQIMHPFDGHGYLRAVRLEGAQRAHLRGRFVQTQAYQIESQAGSLQFRGIGTQLDSWWGNLKAPVSKNVSNTCIVPWAGKLLSLYEGGRPYQLDPETLETGGVEDLSGALPKEVPILAHTRYDAAQERLVLCSPTMGRNTGLCFYELDERGAIVHTAQTELQGMTLLHDFLITPHYYLVMVNPMMPRLGTFLKFKAGMAPLIQALRVDSRPTEVLLLPRDGQGEARVFALDRSLFSFHHADAKELLDDEGRPEQVLFHTCAFARPFAFGAEFGYQGIHAPFDPGHPDPSGSQKLLQIGLQLSDGSATCRELSPYSFDFPRIHPQRDGLACRYFYAGTTEHKGINFPITAVAKFDVQREQTSLWAPGDGHFVGEPVFAPRTHSGEESEEDDGWLLAMLYDGQHSRSTLAIFDAQDLSAGPCAKIHMPCLLPYGFHGHWAA